MTIILKNVDEKLLKVIESLSGIKNDLEIEKIPNNKLNEAIKQSEDILKNPTKTKGYKDMDSLKKALLK